MNDLLKRSGLARTDLHCTNCQKNFVAQIDHDLDGNHVIQCPFCSHEHCRVIKAGVVTGDRWDSRASKRVEVPKNRVWQVSTQPMMTSSASAFIRDRWLNRDDLE